MEILEVDSVYYSQTFPKTAHVFNNVAFNAVNEYKCEKVYYLLFTDTKVRLGIIFGVRNNKLVSPFSAPFGGFEPLDDDIRLQYLDMALTALKIWAIEKKIEGIRIVQPSFFYAPNFLNKTYNCLYRAGFESANIELNYHFSTDKLNKDYETSIWYNARKNLKRAMQSGLVFEKLESENAKMAYDVIARNRKERGFPLRLTWEQVQETMTVITADFFLVTKAQAAVGAAIIFHVSKDIVQVIYWGDLPQYSEFKTMNFLSYNIFKHYKELGISIIDIGPSTENSIPNHGLCEFKESIGCDISIKTEFYKKLG